ncbi:hypothetical protein PHLCEN_2v9281 [Hermanssonia centrifuga]|uniref:DUF6535 domain-containing protein n=1 Tax=Hermanssonia centrifuga TaxID=98765 RepID=A0A2R6NRD1_9APHY|nr:hypothetical protein PHLCEN_2v9281 [Hermanssonia centrifuga]
MFLKSKTRKSTSKNGALEGEKGWTTVEDYINRHDNLMLKDYDEDINALLIIAGLFSAVLTAFIVESFQWLQEDYTQTSSELLALIYAQSTSSSIATHPSLPSIFEPSVADVWINILWFLSLVLSLAAALFGTIVKQWLREYHMWESESSQNAVWLRQVRFKAFMEWKVPIIVATLPGLLEIAFVLFVIGLIILLWTLHVTVAVVVSIAASGFLLIAFTVTIMPAFSPSCPYKSPIGWAFVLLWNWMNRGLFRLLWFAGRTEYSSYLFHIRWHEEADGWKHRDLQTNLLSEMGTGWGSCSGLDRDLKIETIKLAHLADALAWVCSSSQDAKILNDVHHSIEDIDGPTEARLRLTAPVYAFCRQHSVDPVRFLAGIRSQYDCRILSESCTYTLRLIDNFDAWDPWNAPHGVLGLEILGNILLNNVELFMSDLFSSMCLETKPDPEVMQAFVEALCFLFHVAKVAQGPTFKRKFADMLVDFYHKLAASEHHDRSYPSFRTITVQLLRKMGFVQIDSESNTISVDLSHIYTSFKDHTEMALKLFRSNQGSPDEGRHLFVTLADIAIRKCDNYYTHYYDKDLFEALLQAVGQMLQHSLEHNLPNCGFYGDLPLLHTLCEMGNSNPEIYSSIPPSLLENAELCIQRALVSGKDLDGTLRRLREHSDAGAASLEGRPAKLKMSSMSLVSSVAGPVPASLTVPAINPSHTIPPDPKPLPLDSCDSITPSGNSKWPLSPSSAETIAIVDGHGKPSRHECCDKKATSSMYPPSGFSVAETVEPRGSPLITSPLEEGGYELVEIADNDMDAIVAECSRHQTED